MRASCDHACRLALLFGLHQVSTSRRYLPRQYCKHTVVFFERAYLAAGARLVKHLLGWRRPARTCAPPEKMLWVPCGFLWGICRSAPPIGTSRTKPASATEVLRLQGNKTCKELVPQGRHKRSARKPQRNHKKTTSHNNIRMRRTNTTSTRTSSRV